MASTTVLLPRMIPHTWRVVGNAPTKTLLSVFPGGAEAMWQESTNLPAGPPDMQQMVEICARYGVTFRPLS